MITTTALTAMTRQTLSATELTKVAALIAEYGDTYDSVTDAIQDARTLLS